MGILYDISSSIQNGQLNKKLYIYQKKTNMNSEFLNFLWKNNLILGYFSQSKRMKIFLKYARNKPAIKSILLIAKSNKRIYLSVKQLWQLKITSKLVVISTSKGLKNLKECKKQNIAGELVAIVN
jgi:small subunit ribosomal protein S8